MGADWESKFAFGLTTQGTGVDNLDDHGPAEVEAVESSVGDVEFERTQRRHPDFN